MKAAQQELPFRQWGGARKGAGRKRQSARPNVPHRPRQGFRKGALHVTLRMRREVWNLRIAPVLPRAALGLCPRLRALRLPLGGVLRAGEPHSGLEVRMGAGAQQGHAPQRRQRDRLTSP